MTKIQEINVKDTTIRTIKFGEVDYICITDIARQKNPLEPKDVVKNWMRLKNTIEYLGLWEMLNNPDFKGVEFDPLLMQAGSNAFTLNPTRWIELTNAIGLITKNGRGGGTYAQRDIAFKFASWVSVEFELYLIKEFQRLKEEEQKQLGWSAKRELSKINYHIHTDAVRANLVPDDVDAYHSSLIYAYFPQRDRLHKLNKITIQHMKNIQSMLVCDRRERRTQGASEEVGNVQWTFDSVAVNKNEIRDNKIID